MTKNDLINEVTIPLMDYTSTVLSFEHLHYTVQKRSKYLLKDVSGTFRSGRLAAIIGPSGAGKTTLMNVLSGFKVNGVEGQITVNDVSVDRQQYRQMVAYNPQDVALLPNITVRETLLYAADLKMPSSVASSRKQKLVNEIISLLGMEKCADSQARLLSGGEKKRLSIGQELVSNPRIMLFDEPTSGLDSESSLQVISYLKELARQGRCVVSVIHQPGWDLLELFDDIYVVKDGQCLYKGSLEHLIPTFADVGMICPQYCNKAEFVIKMASKSNAEAEKVHTLIERMKTKTNSSTHLGFNNKLNRTLNGSRLLLDDCVRRGGSQYPISQWRQFAILTRRTALGTVRNFNLTFLRLVGNIVFALIIGAVYYNIGNDGAKVLSNISLLMLMLMFTAFANSMIVILSFPLEMAVFLREYKSNCYSVLAYFFSKLVADFPLMVGSITSVFLIAYPLTGQVNETPRMLMFWTMCLLTAWFTQVYGMLAGSIFSIEVSPWIVPVTLVPPVMFSGFFIRYNELFDVLKPLTYASPFRYTFEGISLAIYGYDRKDLGCSEMFCYFRKAKKVLEMLDMENSDFWLDVVGISTIILLLHILLYISLRVQVR